MQAPRARDIVVTGAAGSLAADILPGLLELGYRIVALDRRIPRESPECTWVRADITDRTALREAFAGCAAVVHLAGIPLESDWEALLRTNIDGTQAVLDAARSVGARRVVLASSIHAAGFVPVPTGSGKVPDAIGTRPDTFYGVSKAAGEALGSLYHDRYGLDVICLRIASRCARPLDERMLSTWLSPADAVRLVDAALTAEDPGFRVVWGVSRNTRGYLAPTGGEAIGYLPRDDAEVYAEAILRTGASVPAVPAAEWDRYWIGGIFCSTTPPSVDA